MVKPFNEESVRDGLINRTAPSVRHGIRVCHPFGNPNVYNCVLSFAEAGELTQFHTSLYNPFNIHRRWHPELSKQWVTTHPMREVVRLGARMIPIEAWNGRRPRFSDWVNRNFDSTAARVLSHRDRAVYCYENAAIKTFVQAKMLGITRIYELPIMYHREMARIFQLEIDKEPGLAPFLRNYFNAAWMEKMDTELSHADVVVVPSTFVRESIERFLALPVRYVVAPYGADVTQRAKVWNQRDQEGPLRLIFVGSLAPRKGLHILFDALEKLPQRQFHLTLAGIWEPGYREWLRGRYQVDYEWLGGLDRSQVYAACRSAHVFVLPSLAEGFALVILEAIASGIPVLTTELSGAANVLTEGTDGWIIKGGDPGMLKTRLETIADNRDRLPEMGAAARRTAEAYSWERYRKILRDGVMNALDCSSHKPAAIHTVGVKNS